MKKLIELENGLMMEVEASPSEIEQMSGADIIEKVESSMGMVERMLVKSVEPIINAYNTLNQEVVLEKAEIEIGIGFSAEGNIFIAQGKANANLKVKLVVAPKS